MWLKVLLGLLKQWKLRKGESKLKITCDSSLESVASTAKWVADLEAKGWEVVRGPRTDTAVGS